jgi:hypothetical protein
MPSIVSAVRERLVRMAIQASWTSDAKRTAAPYSFVSATTGSSRAALMAG